MSQPPLPPEVLGALALTYGAIAIGLGAWLTSRASSKEATPSDGRTT